MWRVCTLGSTYLGFGLHSVKEVFAANPHWYVASLIMF